jgi:hypothetical protein
MPDTDTNLPSRITVSKACELIGGDRPIDPSTFYRGVRRKIYPAPERAPGTNVSRVNTQKLLRSLGLRKD